MAKIVPSDFTRLALSETENPELETLAELKKSLPPDYTVFHGVHWTREYDKNTVFGEIDFIIINRSGEVLVIEQKNGWLEQTDDGLFKNYGDRQKNVGDQVRRSLENVREKFSSSNTAEAPLNLNYLIYAPDFRLKQVNAATLDESRIVDARNRDNLADQIENLLGPGTSDHSEYQETVADFFHQTVELIPDVLAHIAAHQRSFSKLTGRLDNILNNIEVEPLLLKVSGTAGCGKSAAAVQFFKRAITNGKRPLLVCFNRPLSEAIKRLVPADTGMVSTWYGFCDSFLSERGHTLDFEQMTKDVEFWTKIQDRVVEEDIPAAWLFDTLIIDEGQDFEPEWLDILKLFLRDDHQIIWFEDQNQNLRGAGDVHLPHFVTYHARTNFRSPEKISTCIRKLLPFEFEVGNTLPGKDVGIHYYKNSADQQKKVEHLIKMLVRDDFDVGDIAVVTCRGLKNSPLSGIETLGGHRVRRFAGKYDNRGHQVFTEGKLLFDSIYRFKGQQAHAVILTDVAPEEEKKSHWERLLYTGMTRASVRLEILVEEGNSALPFSTI